MAPDTSGLSVAFLEAEAQRRIGRSGIAAEGVVMVVEFEDGSFYVMDNTNRDYTAGEEYGTPQVVWPKSTFLGNGTLPTGVGYTDARTPAKVHVLGNVGVYTVYDKTAAQAILDTESEDHSDPYKDDVLVCTYVIPVEDREEYDPGQYISAGIPLENSDGTV